MTDNEYGEMLQSLQVNNAIFCTTCPHPVHPGLLKNNEHYLSVISINNE